MATGDTREESIGKTTLDLSFWKNSRERDRFYRIMQMESCCKNLEIPIITRYKKEVTALISSSMMQWDNSTYIISVIRDITTNKELKKKLKIQARTDMLTGIMNRRSFMETAEKQLLDLRSHGQKAAFLMLDIDWFKSINDTYGHTMGDRAICLVTAQCQKLMKGQDLPPGYRYSRESDGAIRYCPLSGKKCRKKPDICNYLIKNSSPAAVPSAGEEFLFQ